MPLSDSSATFMRALRPKPSPAVLLLVGSRRLRGLPVLVHEASRRVWGLRLRRTERRLAIGAPARVAFRQCKSVSVLIASFRSSIPSPPVPLFTLRHTSRGVQRKTRGRVVRYSFLVGLLHSLLHAGLARRAALAICTNPLAREGMLLWHLDRVLGTQGGVHDLPTPAHAGRSPAAQLLRTHDPSLHPYRC